MKFQSKVMTAAMSLCLVFSQSASVFAAMPEQRKSIEQSSLLQIPVVFREDHTAKKMGLARTLKEGTIEKYTEGTLVAYTLNGDAQVRVGDRLVSVEPTTIAISDDEKEKLKKEQEKEAENRNRRDDAQAKIDAEKKNDEAAAKNSEAVGIDEIEEEALEVEVGSTYSWTGSVLSRSAGVNQGPSGKETYYNLPMQGVVSIMRSIGNNDEYWVREDGVKMLGSYVMVAAHLPTRPRGSLVPTSLGMGIVCDTGTFALSDHTQLDIAVAW